MATLYRMDGNGANIHQIGKSTLFEGHSSVMDDGRILYDRYSNVSRGKRRKAEAENGEVVGVGAGPASRAARAETRDAQALRRSWAQLIKWIYEVDPLVCPSFRPR